MYYAVTDGIDEYRDGVHLSSTSYDRVIIASNQKHFERDTRRTIRIIHEIKFYSAFKLCTIASQITAS